jgi:hypothetical protein
VPISSRHIPHIPQLDTSGTSRLRPLSRSEKNSCRNFGSNQKKFLALVQGGNGRDCGLEVWWSLISILKFFQSLVRSSDVLRSLLKPFEVSCSLLKSHQVFSSLLRNLKSLLLKSFEVSCFPLVLVPIRKKIWSRSRSEENFWQRSRRDRDHFVHVYLYHF